LRKQTLAVHLLGTFAATPAVTVLWWISIALAGNPFHASNGGTARQQHTH